MALTDAQSQRVETLRARIEALESQYDAILKLPESYSPAGSVAITNRKLADIRREIDEVARELRAYLRGALDGTGDGITRGYPVYG